jgi:hypothetical protein
VNDPLLRMLARLPEAAPEAEREVRLRARCRARLLEQRTPMRLTRPRGSSRCLGRAAKAARYVPSPIAVAVGVCLAFLSD